MTTPMRSCIVLVVLLALTVLTGQAIAQVNDGGKTGVNIDNPSQVEGTLPGETCVGSGGINCPAAIPDGPGGILISTFDAVSCGPGSIIEDVNVGVDITHTWIGDLDITVTSTGQLDADVNLFAQDCSSNDDMQAIWDDEGVPYPCPPVGYGNFIPASPLSAIDGELGDGLWTLTIVDNASLDTGTLNDWSVELTCAGGVPTTPQAGLLILAVLLALAGIAAMALKRRGHSH